MARLREDHSPAHLVPGLTHLGWARPRSASESGLGPHQHVQIWEFCWVVQGTLDWWAGNEACPVPAGHCYITRPDEVHGATLAVLEPCELYWLGLQAGTLPDIEAVLARSPRVFPGSPLLTSLWDDLLSQHRTSAPHAALAGHGILLRICAELARCAEATPAPVPISAAIRAALAHALAHLDDDPAVAALARAAGLGVSQFHARFISEIGEPPAEWMRRQRLERAKRLLVDTNTPITTLALNLGYPSSQYFATVFRRYTGLTPGAYRLRSRTATP
jgi:AraC family transcriptional regulator, L-rhamnose operon regulatory protein RhaS